MKYTRSRRAKFALALALASAAIALAAPSAIATNSIVELVSLSTGGAQGNNYSYGGGLSPDGRYVLFGSLADNFVAGDVNGGWDLFIRDRSTGQTDLVSVSSDEEHADGESGSRAYMSADDRHVFFDSVATNLVPADTNGTSDVFDRDLWTGTTTRVSLPQGGGQSDGDSYVTGRTEDGRYVLFASTADNLVPDDTNNDWDGFVYDRITHSTNRVTLADHGGQANGFSEPIDISASGRYIAFQSVADNVVAHDTNGRTDAFVFDRQTRRTRRVSVSSTGQQGDGESRVSKISADGRFISFYSSAPNLTEFSSTHDDAYIYDMLTKRTTILTPGGDNVSQPREMSADGRYVLIDSYATNLVPGDLNNTWDSFVYDRVTTQMKRVSVSATGEAGNEFAAGEGMSSDGRYVGYTSRADNLVPGDTNGFDDIFVVDWQQLP